jgi:hypothetical protein
MNAQIKDSYLNNYIDSCTVINNYPGKKTFYVILQRHAAAYDKRVDKKIRKESIKEALSCQVSIYKILDALREQKFPGQKNRLELILNEGANCRDTIDITKGKSLAKQMKKLTPSPDDENELKKYISEGGGDAAAVIGLRYADLFIAGFEEEGAPALPIIKGLENYHNYSPEMSKEDRKLAADYASNIINNAAKRSDYAIKYAHAFADFLKEKGMIKNKDAAIVIGAGHEYDFLRKGLEKNTDYNLVIISPKGIYKK